MTVKKKKYTPDEIINRGGEVRSDKKKREWTAICLRIPKDMVEDIDTNVDERPGMTRTAWILEAIHEKLKRR